MSVKVTINSMLAGVTMEPARQARLQRIYELIQQGYESYMFKLRLIHEADNKYDANAVRVDVWQQSIKQWVDLGFIPRKGSGHVAPVVDAGLIEDVRLDRVDFFVDEETGERKYFCSIKIQPKQA